LWLDDEKLSVLQNHELCISFDEEEIRAAIFQMERNKATWFGGLPTEFFQTCWQVIKHDLVHLCEEFHAGRLYLTRINFGLTTLIPKKKGADMIHLFSSLYLLNVFLIFSKVLSIRFDSAIDIVILSYQNIFCKGRNIMDVVISLHEILHESRIRKK
jgi:hypothetical protein